MKNKIYTIIIILFSILCGILSKDHFLGTLTLVSGLLNGYYASIGKTYNYIFGALYCLLSAYICYINGLYATSVLSLIVYFLLQIQGYMSWLNKKDNKNEVSVKKFTLKKSIIVVFSCITGSLLFGLLLNKIPTQQLAFLDSTSNTINLCGTVLMNLRYQECWLVWLFMNTIDIIIWLINLLNGNPNSFMMLLVTIGYLIINVYAIYKWNKKIKKKE